MKKYFVFILLALIYFGSANTAQAKSWLLDTSQSKIITLDHGLVLELLDWDKSKVKLNVELQDQADGSMQLGVYPSNKKISYRLQIISGPMLNYQILGQTNTGWQDLSQTINANKILLKVSTGAVADLLAEADDLPTANNTNGIVTVTSKNNVSITKAMAPVNNGSLKLISPFYQISNAQEGDEIEFKYSVQDYSSKQIYQYNKDAQAWEAMTAYNDVVEKKLITKLVSSETVVAIFADDTTHDGIASFYDQSRYRYFGYKNGDFAASRDYPKGTKLKITRLKTNESVIVEVNDYGPELSTGRLVDLDISAFKKIGSTRAGLIYVKVEPYNSNK